MGIQQRQVSDSDISSDEYYVQPHKMGEWTIYKRLHAGTPDETLDWVGTIGDYEIASRITRLLNNEPGAHSS